VHDLVLFYDGHGFQYTDGVYSITQNNLTIFSHPFFFFLQVELVCF
jgi:hypothetical protein